MIKIKTLTFLTGSFFLLGLLISLQTARAFPPNLSLGHNYNEASGTSATDSSSNANTGTLVNGTLRITGKYGGGLSFDNINDHVLISDSPSLRLSRITLSAWVNPSSLSNNDVIIGKNRGNQGASVFDDYWLALNSNGQIEFCLEQSTESDCVSSTSTVSLNQWTHVAATWDGTTMRVYKNGIQDSASAFHSTNPVYGNSSVYIGAENENGTIMSFFNGKIDEVRLYNRALSLSEIQSDMNDSGIGSDVTPPIVSLTAPGASTTVSDTITVSADATDNVGVLGVQFLLDGNNLEAEDLSAPYSISWNTASSSNGIYTLLARARDAAGNSATTSLSVTVNNALPPPPATTTEFYVSPTGSDSNPGTLAEPFLTLSRAQSAVRTANTNMAANITVYIREGTYTLANTLTLGALDSGTNGFNVIWKAYPGEKPVISGGQNITGWTSIGGGVWKAQIGTLRFRQLYVNGTRTIRARTPNAGSYYNLINYDGVGDRVQINAGEISNWGNINQVEMNLLGKGVNNNYLRVGSFTTSGGSAFVTPQEPERSILWSRIYPVKEPGRPYFWENAYEFLDSAGEWYIDTTTNELFYMPRAGENMLNASVVAPRLENIVRVQGTLSNPAHHIQFYGITFEHATWNLPSINGYVGDQGGLSATGAILEDEITFYEGDRPSAGFYMEATDNIRLERNVFRHFGGTGITLHVGNHNTVIIGNVVEDVSNTGIALDMNLEGNPSDTRKISKDNTVSNNYIHDIGKDYYSSIGIIGGYVDGVIIEHNQVNDTPYSAISVGWGWEDTANAARNNLVRYNNVFNFLDTMSDGGGLYTLSRQPGTTIYENYVHDVVRTPIHGAYIMPGIYLDEGSNFITVQDNVIQNVDGVSGQTAVFQNAPGPSNTFINNSGVSAATIANAGIEPAYQDILPEPPPPDTINPTSSVTTPVASSTVSVLVDVTANASDNVGVVGVQFLLDGNNLGGEDLSVPYLVSWNTASSSNGAHTLLARARDAAGNLGTSSPILVTVNNVTPPPPPPPGNTVTVDSTKNSPDLSNQTSGSWPHTVSGSNRYLVVGLSGWDNNSSLTNVVVKYNNITLTKLGGAQLSGRNQAVLWGLVNPPTGTNTVSVTGIPSNFAELGGGSVSFVNVNQTTPTGNVMNETELDASINIPLSVGELGIDILYSGAGSQSPVIDVGGTQRVNTHLTSNTNKWMMMGTEAGTGTTTMSWIDVGGSDFAQAAVPIKPAP